MQRTTAMLLGFEGPYILTPAILNQFQKFFKSIIMSYRIYTSTDTLRCFICKLEGHVAENCAIVNPVNTNISHTQTDNTNLSKTQNNSTQVLHQSKERSHNPIYSEIFKFNLTQNNKRTKSKIRAHSSQSSTTNEEVNTTKSINS